MNTFLIALYILIAILVALGVYHKALVKTRWLNIVIAVSAGVLWPLIALVFIGMAVAMSAPFQL